MHFDEKCNMELEDMMKNITRTVTSPECVNRAHMITPRLAREPSHSLAYRTCNVIYVLSTYLILSEFTVIVCIKKISYFGRIA